jgi:preprotein translocase subunit SecG
MSEFWTSALFDLLLVIYVLDCCFMGLIIMMQRSKQEGLGAAFGGGFTDSIWGAQTSQVLVKATVWAAALFFILSICLARLSAHRASLDQHGSSVQMELEKSAAATPAPAKTNAAPVTAPAPSTWAPTKALPMVSPPSAPPVPAPVPPAPAKAPAQ